MIRAHSSLIAGYYDGGARDPGGASFGDRDPSDLGAFESARRTRQVSPERLLLLALVEAARDDLSQGQHHSARVRALAHDARRWVNADPQRDRDWPYGFAQVCDYLGFDAPTVRRALLAQFPPPLPLSRSATCPTVDRIRAWIRTRRVPWRIQQCVLALSVSPDTASTYVYALARSGVVRRVERGVYVAVGGGGHGDFRTE